VPVIGAGDAGLSEACFAASAPDGLTLPGTLKTSSNVFVAGRHDTKGMVLVPLTGQLVNQLLEGRDNREYGKELSPGRFGAQWQRKSGPGHRTQFNMNVAGRIPYSAGLRLLRIFLWWAPLSWFV
jgi:hypothetical protein